jgi:WD40 repeat protein
MLWSLPDGASLGVLNGHEHVVECVAFSSAFHDADATKRGKMAAITVRLPPSNVGQVWGGREVAASSGVCVACCAPAATRLRSFPLPPPQQRRVRAPPLPPPVLQLWWSPTHLGGGGRRVCGADADRVPSHGDVGLRCCVQRSLLSPGAPMPTPTKVPPSTPGSFSTPGGAGEGTATSTLCGVYVVSGSRDKSVRVWDTRTLEALVVLVRGQGEGGRGGGVEGMATGW